MISQEIWQKVPSSGEVKAERLFFLFYEHTEFFLSPGCGLSEEEHYLL